MELNVTSSSYTVQKFANLTAVNVTAWNPVGEGGKSTLDLSKHIGTGYMYMYVCGYSALRQAFMYT